MKTLKTFLSFVEIQTKLASVMPFLAALAYAFYLTSAINLRNSLIYLVAAFLFDMAVTAINNYMDKRETKAVPHFSRPVSLIIIFAMAIAAGILGLYLAHLYGLAVLLAGMICFVAGIAYTYGPAPVSKSPYGEAVSGFVMGFIIMFIVVSINAPTIPIVDIVLYHWHLYIDINLANLLGFGLVTLPAVCLIANIMLANNICDLEADKATRYTMARHIGIPNALALFATLNCVAYLAIVAASILGILPLWCLITLVTILPVQKNIRVFFKRQSKRETFPLAVKNFMLIMTAFVLTLLLGGVLNLGT
ncbi:MAG: UbiA family prenyltransferase [Treponema sp.]|nr:UbiA family prenyltransferase [Treponema sp.]